MYFLRIAIILVIILLIVFIVAGILNLRNRK